jgi:hypothetical protein
MSVDVQARRHILVDTPPVLPTPVPHTPAHRQAGPINVRSSAREHVSATRAVDHLSVTRALRHRSKALSNAALTRFVMSTQRRVGTHQLGTWRPPIKPHPHQAGTRRGHTSGQATSPWAGAAKKRASPTRRQDHDIDAKKAEAAEMPPAAPGTAVPPWWSSCRCATGTLWRA